MESINVSELAFLIYPLFNSLGTDNSLTTGDWVASWENCSELERQKWRMLHKDVSGHGKVLFLRSNQWPNICLSRWGDYWAYWHGTQGKECDYDDERQMFVDEEAAWEAATK